MQPIAEPTTSRTPLPNDHFYLSGVMAVSIAHFIHDVYSSFLAPLLPLLIEKLSMNLTQAGLLSTVMQLPALINPWIGSLADRFSVRWFLVLAPALTAVPMSLIGVAPTYGVLLILMLFAGISVSMFHVPAPVVVARMSGNRKGLGMSFFMVGGEAARAVGPMVAVGIVALMGLDGFYPVMVVSFVCTALLFITTPGSSGDQNCRRAGSIDPDLARHAPYPDAYYRYPRGQRLHARLHGLVSTYVYRYEYGKFVVGGCRIDHL